MSPMNDFVCQLFPYLARDKIHQFQCGHVIQKSQLLPVVVSKGPSNCRFNFGFENRSNPVMVQDCGKVITDVCRAVAGGVVVFFPSYSYLEFVIAAWTSSGLLSGIEHYKSVFCETASSGANTEDILARYTSSVDSGTKNGAILFAVVGGKMSEGINFSDSLGRAVVSRVR
ncbi:ATP-dependent DNA helicase chl1 [Kappamyces sp. JEL0680]|nr:ATP-dependent DNA helicase chl1 [Kappamyces sp. JEL0680]